MIRIYRNYGDVNFMERGRLVQVYFEDGQPDEPAPDEAGYLSILYCEPYCDAEDQYLIAELVIDMDDVYNPDSWIDREEVESFGCCRLSDDVIGYILAVIDYYGTDNFTGGYCCIDMDSRGVAQMFDAFTRGHFVDWAGLYLDSDYLEHRIDINS